MPVPKRFLFWDRQAPAVSVAKILFVCHGRRAWIRKTSRGCSSFWVTSIAFNAFGPNTANATNSAYTWQTFTFETKDIFITDMPCELLFQFGSEATAALGGVTVEFTSVTIYQMPVM